MTGKEATAPPFRLADNDLGPAEFLAQTRAFFEHQRAAWAEVTESGVGDNSALARALVANADDALTLFAQLDLLDEAEGRATARDY